MGGSGVRPAHGIGCDSLSSRSGESGLPEAWDPASPRACAPARASTAEAGHFPGGHNARWSTVQLAAAADDCAESTDSL